MFLKLVAVVWAGGVGGWGVKIRHAEPALEDAVMCF